MTRITINGWPSFEAWRDAGYPGALKSWQLPSVRQCIDCHREIEHGKRCRRCADLILVPLKDRYKTGISA